MGSGRSASITKDEQEFIAILSVATANRLGNVKKEQELHTYQQFFSQKVISSLLDKGDAFLDGKDTEVSVLFCDIRGFSKATDTMEANAAMQWLSDTLSELSQVVLDADGVLVDYVGDELFAMWGAPDEDPSHGYSAIRAAIKMMEIKRMLNERYKGKIRFKIDFGIGLNTGMARVGNTGSRQKFKYGPMGRTVNLGSRIQGLTKQWQVSTLMAETTAAFVPPDTPKRRLCQAKVVGLDGHVSLYQLMSQQEANDDLIARYAEGLALFESGQQFRQAAKLFGELVQKYPEDGPSLIMLDRSVNQLVHPIGEFSPVWEAPTK
jgi:adenylate cyclase